MIFFLLLLFSVQSCQYFGTGSMPEITEVYLVFTESGLEETDNDVLAHKVVTTRVYESQEVTLTTHFFHVNTGKPVTNGTVVTCRFGEDTDAAVFNIRN